LRQKEARVRAGLPVTEFCAVASPATLAAAGERLGWPLALKTRRNGYEGKGHCPLRSPADLPAAWHALRRDLNELFAEAFWSFTQELAAIVTRGRAGTPATSPGVETVQHHHVCHSGQAPAAIAPALAARATEIALRAVTAGAAHLPGMVASYTPLSVIGVPVVSKSLKGLDSLLSIGPMPGGIPVATIGLSGARNAGLPARSILPSADPARPAKLIAFKRNLAADSRRRGRDLRATLAAKNRPSAKT
jgi:phosphoribosylaminoimidazole carboxylase PurE protein